MQQTEGEARTRRRLAKAAAVLATFAISMVFGYFAVRGVKVGAAWRALRGSNYWWLGPSLGALAISIVIRAVRWWTLFRPDRRPPIASLVRATLIGFFFNSILPVRAGEAARIVAVKQYAGTSRAETTGTVIVERILDVCSLIVLLFVLVPWLPAVSWLEPAAIVAFACLAAAIVLAIFAKHVSDRPTPTALRLLSRLPGFREETVDRLATNTVHGLAALGRPRQAVAALAWTFLSWLVLGLSFWLLMLAFDLGLSPVAGLFVVIATSLAFIIPAAPAAIGVFEAAGLAVTSAYHVGVSRGFAYVIALHALNLFPFLLAGLVVLGGDTLRWRRVA
jgi:uncharacterized protein (TIRG00374 family)